MSYSSGSFSLVSGNPVVTGTVISSTWANNTLSDVATGLSTCVLKDGTQTLTADIPMNSHKLTGLSAGSATGHSLRYEQLFSTSGVNLLGAVNETLTIVASATTPDIWTTIGNVVSYTGVTTATGFAAAPQAGARRTLVCTGSAPFTAGANMLIQGYASGNTFTASAGDQVDVVAITTTQFRLTMRPTSGLPVVGTSVPRSYLSDCAMSTAGSSATLTVAAGMATDSTNAAVMSLASSTAKTTGSWAVGSGNGGLDTGSIASSTWYHFYLIQRPDTGVVDVLFSLSASAPTMPANYTLKRRIGSAKTDGSSNWTKFFQDGDLFVWDVPTADISSVNPTTSAVSRTMNVPSGVRVRGLFYPAVQSASTAVSYGLLSDLSQTDTAPAAGLSNFAGGSTATGTFYSACLVDVMTNTSQQIRSRMSQSDANLTITIGTRGWIDTRGKDS